MEKINKTQARKMFNQGINLQMIPNKCNPNSAWFEGAYIFDNSDEDTFDTLVNKITRYNCNSELGYYLAYYVV